LTASRSIELTPAEAADRIDNELGQAWIALGAHDLEPALDGYVRALGLALQLGPAPTEQVLVAILQAARELALRRDADGLSALGPALVGLVTQVRHAGALSHTAVMEAWATVADGLGVLTGQLGLALTLPPDRRAGMMSQARAHATLLEDASGGLFGLVDWLDDIARALRPPDDEAEERQEGS
jgi:hypothetical protein